MTKFSEFDLTDNQQDLIIRLTQNPERQTALAQKLKQANRSLSWKPYTGVLEEIRNLDSPENVSCDFSNSHVSIGGHEVLTETQSSSIKNLAEKLIPWKKGPFRLFNLEIDAEWQSHFKWDRLVPNLPDLKGKVILDIGCNNGYYLFRMQESQPDWILGIDPFQRPFLQFELLQRFINIPTIMHQMLGWEDLAHMDPIFDVVFCMGIVYHHRDPYQVLKQVYSVLKPGGTIVLETIVIPGDEPFCLVPQDRYANMRNVFFVPTESATLNWLHKTKFSKPHCISNAKHMPEEQRTTEWNPSPSYQDFLDPKNSLKTTEGYPSPHRAIFLAEKPKKV